MSLYALKRATDDPYAALQPSPGGAHERAAIFADEPARAVRLVPMVYAGLLLAGFALAID